MPKGYIITRWTDDEGLQLYLNYPKDLTVDLDDMMRVFYAHITGAGEAGNVLVRLEKAQCNVSSYFTGLEHEMPLMINLMLELGEDPDMFGEAIIQQFNQSILDYIIKYGANVTQAFEAMEKLKAYLKNALFLLERLKNLTKEQLLAQIYSNKKKRVILSIMHKGPISKKDLRNKIEDSLNVIISNIDTTLDPFIKTNLIKQDWIEGLSEVFLFLINDFTIIRAPPRKIVQDAKKNRPTSELAQKYSEKVKEFFLNYEPDPQDSLRIAQTLMNPDKYDFLSLFRERPYPMNKIPKGEGTTFTNIESLIQSMISDNILTLIKDNRDIDWVFLLTDITAQIFYPEYLLEIIRKEYMSKTLKNEVAIKHLELLEKAYIK